MGVGPSPLKSETQGGRQHSIMYFSLSRLLLSALKAHLGCVLKLRYITSSQNTCPRMINTDKAGFVAGFHFGFLLSSPSNTHKNFLLRDFNCMYAYIRIHEYLYIQVDIRMCYRLLLKGKKKKARLLPSSSESSLLLGTLNEDMRHHAEGGKEI